MKKLKKVKKISTSWSAEELALYLDGFWEILPSKKGWNVSLFTTLQLSKLNRNFDHMDKHMAIVSTNHGIPDWITSVPMGFIVGIDIDFPVDDRPILRVKNPEDVFYKLALFGRNRIENFGGSVVAVTGSVGKTSVKDLLSYVLHNFGNVVNSRGSLNALTEIQWGLAAGVLQPDFTVLEVCENFLAGRQTRTKDLIKPKIAIITQASLAHADEIDCVDNDEDMARLLCKIVEKMDSDGVVLINREIKHFSLIKDYVLSLGYLPVSYGIRLNDTKRNDIDVYITSIIENPENSGSIISAIIYGEEFEFKRPTFSVGMALNSLAVLAAVYHLGLDVKKAAKILSHAPVTKSREETYKIELGNKKDYVEIVDDCYNAQPLSIMESINTLKFRHPQPGGRKIFIMGDVTVFKDSRYKDGYFSFVLPFQNSGFDKIFFFGNDVGVLAQVLNPSQVGGVYVNQELLLEAVFNELRSNDLCVVKVTSAGIKSKNLALNLINKLNNEYLIK